jgi:2-amino-4-hydroxy-6-hydroxymethyldihydropteridine diphosphokinase
MILIALGSSLNSRAGPPDATLRAALEALDKSGIAIAAVSRFYESPAWPDPSDPMFINAVALVATALPPLKLLEALHGIEKDFGRIRGKRNAPRTLDLDLLDYDGRIEAGPPVLPHPRIAERAFVLVPLKDVAPDWCHPGTGESVDSLLAAIPTRERAAIRALEA